MLQFSAIFEFCSSKKITSLTSLHTVSPLQFDTDSSWLYVQVETDLTFVALVGIIDPPRPECILASPHPSKSILSSSRVTEVWKPSRTAVWLALAPLGRWKIAKFFEAQTCGAQRVDPDPNPPNSRHVQVVMITGDNQATAELQLHMDLAVNPWRVWLP